MSTQLANLFDSKTEEILSVLPTTVNIDRFKATATQGILNSSFADKLLNANPQTLFNAVLKAAQAGVMLDNDEAVLIPYGQVVNMIPMYKGLVKVAIESGAAKKIYAEVVYSNDRFKYSSTDGNVPEHEVDWFGDRGEPKGAFAVAITDGAPYVAILTQDKIMAVASDTRNKDKYTVGKGHWQEWWKKTAIRNLCKQLPKTERMAIAEQADNEAVDFELSKEKTARNLNESLGLSSVETVIESTGEVVAIEEKSVLDMVKNCQSREQLKAIFADLSEQDQKENEHLFLAKAKDFK